LATKKKVRTPAPPRPVQAPQKRDGRRRADASQRRPWWHYGLAALVPVAAAVVLGAIFLGGNGSAKKSAGGQAPKIDYAGLPGMQQSKPPWQPELSSLPDRLAPLKVAAFSNEQFVQHIHQHLDIFVDGKKLTVPAGIGFYGDPTQGGFLTELHTHDGAGIIHVESATTKPYTLGQFFGIWGVRLSKKCIGGLCATTGKPLRVYVDGKAFAGDPNNVILRNHEEIAVVYGKAPKKIPSTFGWKAAGV
jgi:hypothetical protein